MHFESQCIPTPLAWYAHHLPTWFLRLTTVAVNILELVVPFLFFFPSRKVRTTAFYAQVSTMKWTSFINLYTIVPFSRVVTIPLSFQMFLQIHIIATGNYNFFNFLTICLSISLLDDQFFYKRKSRNNSYNIVRHLSTILCILVYTGVLYGTCVHYNVRITDNWTIQSDIGTYKRVFTSEE